MSDPPNDDPQSVILLETLAAGPLSGHYPAAPAFTNDGDPHRLLLARFIIAIQEKML